MTARSPRATPPPSISWMAVLLPVPVVPMNLKCLVSSACVTARPPSVMCQDRRCGEPSALRQRASAPLPGTTAVQMVLEGWPARASVARCRNPNAGRPNPRRQQPVPRRRAESSARVAPRRPRPAARSRQRPARAASHGSTAAPATHHPREHWSPARRVGEGQAGPAVQQSPRAESVAACAQPPGWQRGLALARRFVPDLADEALMPLEDRTG